MWLWKNHVKRDAMMSNRTSRLQNDWLRQKPPHALDRPPASAAASVSCHCRMNSLPPPPVMFTASSPQISQRLHAAMVQKISGSGKTQDRFLICSQ